MDNTFYILLPGTLRGHLLGHPPPIPSTWGLPQLQFSAISSAGVSSSGGGAPPVAVAWVCFFGGYNSPYL